MERAAGNDAGRVSDEARFDISFADDMAVWLMQRANELGAHKVSLRATEATDTGECSVEIEVEMQSPLLSELKVVSEG